jgi:SAF domain
MRNHRPQAGHASTAVMPDQGRAIPRATERSGLAAGRAAGSSERLPIAGHQRRPAIAALGVLLVVGFAAVSAALVVRGSHSVPVLALARTVPAGQPLTNEDLRVAEISGSGVSALAASARSVVVGETATSTLTAGTLLNAGMLTRTPAPPAGQQVVALSLKSGAVPAEVAAGRSVSLIRLPVASSTGVKTVTAPAVLVPAARVLNVASDPTDGSVELSVQVSSASAPTVAQLAATGGLSVTLLAVTG